MKSRIRYDDENNVYVESKLIQKYNAYYNKIKSIKDVVNGKLDDVYTIPEGTKVKLNYENIINEPDYTKKVKAYREFVENNKNKIFTVQYDEKYKNKPILVSLKEDTNEIKWLWYCETDLIVLDE